MPSLHFNEGYHAIPLDHQVDIPVTAPKATLHHPPAPSPKPPLGYPLSQFTECLPGR
jgi:hypothetical protein